MLKRMIDNPIYALCSMAAAVVVILMMYVSIGFIYVFFGG
jgi:hypothetical protein